MLAGRVAGSRHRDRTQHARFDMFGNMLERNMLFDQLGQRRIVEQRDLVIFCYRAKQKVMLQ